MPVGHRNNGGFLHYPKKDNLERACFPAEVWTLCYSVVLARNLFSDGIKAPSFKSLQITRLTVSVLPKNFCRSVVI